MSPIAAKEHNGENSEPTSNFLEIARFFYDLNHCFVKTQLTTKNIMILVTKTSANLPSLPGL